MRSQTAPKGHSEYRQGLEPLLMMKCEISPDGATERSATPSGLWIYDTIYRGFASLHHLPVIFSDLRSYLQNLNKQV